MSFTIFVVKNCFLDISGVLHTPGSFDISMLEMNQRKRVANLCGKLQEPVTYLSEGAMDIFFITNNNVSRKGFLIEYTAEFGKHTY